MNPNDTFWQSFLPKHAEQLPSFQEESQFQRQVRDLSCRANFREFLPDSFSAIEENTRLTNSWYLGCVAEHAQAVFMGQLPRLVVTQPPGTLKSITWCVSFPAWCWIDYPQTRFLVGTHDLSNASRDAGYCRKLIGTRWYQESFTPNWRLTDDQNAKLFYQTTQGGHRLSVSTGGSTAGKKGHILLLDDIHDAKTIHSKTAREGEKQWFRLAFSDRMMSFKSSALIVIGHRLRKDDLAGELIQEGWPELKLPEEFTESKRKTFPVAFTLNNYPAQPETKSKTQEDPRKEGEWLRPERFGPVEKVDRVGIGGKLSYKAKHQQDPEERTDAMFNPDRVNYVKTYPVGTVAVRYWDTAASESESACASSGVLIGKTPEGRYIVIDVHRGHWKPADRNRHMRNNGLQDMHRPGLMFRRLYWEKGTADSGVERDQLLARILAGIPCAADRAKGPKVQRAEALSSQWDAGNIDIVIGDWNKPYLERMAEFPSAADKDDTDATAGGFNKLAMTDDDPEGWATAAVEDTHLGQLPSGVFENHPQTDPYA